MSDTPVPPEAVRAADPKRPPFAEWPQEALIAALEALDFRVMHAGLDISAHQAVLLASDILHGAAPAIRAAERERYSASFRGPVAYLIGLVDGMRKMYAADEDDWARYRECFRQVRDELAVLLPENDDARPEPAAPGTAAAIAATERERIRQRAQDWLDAAGEDDYSPAARAVADIILGVRLDEAPPPVTGDGDE